MSLCHGGTGTKVNDSVYISVNIKNDTKVITDISLDTSGQFTANVYRGENVHSDYCKLQSVMLNLFPDLTVSSHFHLSLISFQNFLIFPTGSILTPQHLAAIRAIKLMTVIIIIPIGISLSFCY